MSCYGYVLRGDMSLELALSRSRDHRVLSIQSHVVHGYAGNKCSVFPLQLHGFEVDFINSVQFSNHAGNVEYMSLPSRYEHVKGQKLSDKELNELFDGLKLNGLDNYSHVLTGYCGNVTFLNKICDIVTELKKKSPDTIFVCDPVMGDNGKYYTPRELLPVYRDMILPLADVLTPNAFELSQLVGFSIETQEDCLKGMDIIHEKGVKIIVVTSGVEKEQTNQKLCCFASTTHSGGERKRFRFNFPRLPGQYVGTGDVFAALLIVWLSECKGDVASAVGNILGSMQGLLTTTSAYAQAQVESESRSVSELRLVQSRKELLVPSSVIEAIPLAL